jgi:YD repeat-containing protein
LLSVGTPGPHVNNSTYTYTWDAASRLITVTDGISTYGFRYDGDGNRLTRIVDGADTYAYRYDGDGNRFERIINGTLITHGLDVGLALPEVLIAYESAGTVWYLHLPTGVASDDGAAWTYSAPDDLGSVRQELDESGQVAGANSFRPFGTPLEGNGGDPYGYTGESWESETELLYLRARYYEPTLPQSIRHRQQCLHIGTLWRAGTQ